MSDTTMADDDTIVSMMKALKLVDLRGCYKELIAEAEETSMGYRGFLVRLLTEEKEGKESRRQARLLKDARFESENTLDDIDYSFNTDIKRDQIENLGRLGFLKRRENIVLIGPEGVGKTMIAAGIGRKACSSGYRVLFVNVKELLDSLHLEATRGTLESALARLAGYHLLILDELSYFEMDKERESLFYQIVRQRYEKSSLIVTTNLPYSRWKEVFTSELAVTAILGRLTHHCHTITINGDSYRVKGKKN